MNNWPSMFDENMRLQTRVHELEAGLKQAQQMIGEDMAIAQQEQARILELEQQSTLLAEVVLVAHKGKGGICADCPHVEYGEDYQRCKGGEYDCCKCHGCRIAREIMKAKP